jgi:glycosyltransferase involved in cell wall biosynthesis
MTIRVLMCAYACEPGQGSEPGTGWAWAREMSRHCDVTVITRRANREAIQSTSEPLSVRWEYVDLPPWARFWKRGRRGTHLYYYIWQIMAGRRARRLNSLAFFNIAHHVTFAKSWLPSGLSAARVPFIFGPVGGHESAPSAFVRELDIVARSKELSRRLARAVMSLDPFMRRTARTAAAVVTVSGETAQALHRMGARRAVVWGPPVGFDAHELTSLQRVEAASERDRRAPLLLSVGKLQHWKGFHLGLRVFAKVLSQAPSARYVILGAGPYRSRLERLARSLGVSQGVEFVGHVPREDELRYLAQASLLLHPSFHDPGAWVIVEAMAVGTPCLCITGGGPEQLIGGDAFGLVSAATPSRAVDELSQAALRLLLDQELWSAESRRGRSRAERLMWENRSREMLGLYTRHLQACIGEGSV